ncbi:DUF3795 domain-containing protein [candidate division KSB1 bacterium]
MDFRSKESLYGPCGIYCGACGANDCGGCLSEDIDEYVKNCKFRQCTMEKKVDFCCFCSDYPCNELHVFMNDKWPHHWTMEPNLEFIKKNGVGKWLLAQKEEWTCKKCSTEIKWYQKMCSCGLKLKAWDAPD